MYLFKILFNIILHHMLTSLNRHIPLRLPV